MLRDRFFFPLCAAAAIAMIALALAGPWNADRGSSSPSGQPQEQTQ